MRSTPLPFSALPVACIDDAQLADAMHGRSLHLPSAPAGRVALAHDGQLRAIAEDLNGRYKMDMVFPQGIEGVDA